VFCTRLLSAARLAQYLGTKPRLQRAQLRSAVSKRCPASPRVWRRSTFAWPDPTQL